MTTFPSISIVGYGRFGKVLSKLFGDDFHLTLYQHSSLIKYSEPQNIKITSSLQEVYNSDVIFYAVPINKFEEVLHEHKSFFKPHHLLIDVLSVKVHPKNVFQHLLSGSTTRAMLTHPMFGPDSSKNGFIDLPIIMEQFSSTTTEYNFWKQYFAEKGLNVIEISAEKHDQLAAKSQGLTHLIGRLLETTNFHATPIDSLGTKKLLEVVDQTCHDSLELFYNLHHYNPYTNEIRKNLLTNLKALIKSIDNYK